MGNSMRSVTDPLNPCYVADTCVESSECEMHFDCAMTRTRLDKALRSIRYAEWGEGEETEDTE